MMTLSVQTRTGGLASPVLFESGFRPQVEATLNAQHAICDSDRRRLRQVLAFYARRIEGGV